MLPLLAALTLQVVWKPIWAVADLNDLKHPGSVYGRAASDALASELTKTGRYETVPGGQVATAAAALNIRNPPASLVDLSRVGQAVRANVIVSGEVIDYRIDPGGPARAAVRMVAYDVASGEPVNGALEIGRADLHGGNREAVVREAIGRAMIQTVATMRSRRIPMARILSTAGRGTFVLDRGFLAGFREGMRVLVMAEPLVIGLARVVEVEETRAEIVPVERAMGWTAGRGIRAVFDPPLLPPSGISPLDDPSSIRRG